MRPVPLPGPLIVAPAHRSSFRSERGCAVPNKKKNNTFWVAPLRLRYDFCVTQTKAALEKKGIEKQDAPGLVCVVPKIGLRTYKRFSTGIKTTRANWENSKGDCLDKQAKQLADDLATYDAAIKQAYEQLTEDNSAVTGEMLAAAINVAVGITEEYEPTLANIFAEFLEAKRWQLEESVALRHEESVSPATYVGYSKRWALIHGYLRGTNQMRILIVDVNYPFAFKFKEWMRQQLTPAGGRYAPATINKAVSFLKQLMVYSLGKGYIKTNPLTDFSCRGGSPADPKPLTAEMLDRLENCELPYTLRRFCDAWLVAGELCLHHADFMDLQNCVLVEYKGKRYLQRKRRKQMGSSLTQTVDVTPRAERILAKYGGVKGLAYTSSAYFSKVLKQIAIKANLRDSFGDILNLQFGMGRDTGLTLRAIDGANSVQISKIAGWSKPAYAERYIGNPLAIVAAFAEGRKGEDRG